jgi:hypothetical protein
MKLILIAMLLVVGGCENKSPDTDVTVRYSNMSMVVRVLEVDGHEYIIANGRGTGIVHKEGCKNITHKGKP